MSTTSYSNVLFIVSGCTCASDFDECGVFCGGIAPGGEDCPAATECIDDDGHCTVPGDAVSIGNFAFDGMTALTSVILGNATTSFGVYAFQGTRLTSVVIPDAVTEIPAGAFKNVNTLEDVTFGSNLISIGQEAFYNTRLTDLVIPDSVVQLEYGAFQENYYIRNLTIGSGLSEIPGYAFASLHRVTAIVIPDTVTEVYARAFQHMGTSSSGTVSLHIGSGITRIRSYTFAYCGLTEVEIPGSVEVMESGAFRQCSSLSSVKIRLGVTTIDSSVFLGTALTGTVALPDTVTYVHSTAFPDWVSLCGGAIPLGLDSCPCWYPCTTACEVASSRVAFPQFGNNVSCAAAEDCAASARR